MNRQSGAPGGNTPGYVTRAIEIGGLAAHRAFGDGDTRNPRFHLDACFPNVPKRLAAPRGHPARELFGSGGRMMFKKPPGHASAIPWSRYARSKPEKQESLS